MSNSVINAKTPDIIGPSQQEECPLTIHLGIVFNANGEYPIHGSWVASNYDIEENETNRKYTIVINNSVFPTIDEHFDVDGMQCFGKRVGEVLYDVFSQIHFLLSGYMSKAPNLSIEIDTFCIEEGFFCASMFCEAVERGCFSELPPYASYALSDVEGGGILEDLRMRGANIVLHSFTTFQVKPETNKSIKESGNNEISNETSSSKRTTRNNAYDSSSYVDDEEYIRANEDYSLFKISVKNTRFEGLYSKLCNVEHWLENTALTCDVVALTTSLTGIGVVPGAVCEVISMGLNGINVIVCFTLAGMAIVDGDKETRNQHLQDAAWNTLGALPVGSIIAKSAKEVKFATNKNTIRLVENTTDTISHNENIVRLHPTKKPYLKVVPNSSNQNKVHSKTTEVKNNNALQGQFQVINGGKLEGEWVKVANGSEIFIPKITSQSSNVVFNSIYGFGPINNMFRSIGNSIRTTIDAVQCIYANNKMDMNMDQFHGQDRSMDIIDYEKWFKAKSELQKFVDSNEGFNDTIKNSLSVVLGKVNPNEYDWYLYVKSHSKNSR